jgi:hypothetical protein
VAVTVLAEPTLVLDRRYTVVEVGDSARAEFGRFEGRSLWECLPGSAALFRPYCENAWRLREPVEFVQFYEGQVGRIRATAEGDRLVLHWEVLARLDTLTLERLRSSFVEALSALDRAETSARRDHAHRLLQVVAEAS